jgi:wyosine [tRNA(Phe)-imidazoG37] synthetase (radical SAM superfamily)
MQTIIHKPWNDFSYIYPVVSRRSRGISIGIDLSPTKFCNFNCVYCQVPRYEKGEIEPVNLERLSVELNAMLEIHQRGDLFEFSPFSKLPSFNRDIHDIAFAGTGEPTLAPQFAEIVKKVREIRDRRLGSATKLVLITNSSCLSHSRIQQGLDFMDKGTDEIWAKLDAGTNDHFKRIDRAPLSLEEITTQIKGVANHFPVVLQSMFMRVRGSTPDWREISRYCERVASILASGGKIKLIQIYTVVRKPAEDCVKPLTMLELSRIRYIVQQSTGIPTKAYA